MKDNREMPRDERQRTQGAVPPQHVVTFNGCAFVVESGDNVDNVVDGKGDDLIIFNQTSSRETVTIQFDPASIVTREDGFPWPDGKIGVKRSEGTKVKISRLHNPGKVGTFKADKEPGCPPGQETAEGKIIISGVDP